jgi:hypothetical protein
MELAQSIMWVGLGFVPTLVMLELISKKSRRVVGIEDMRARARAGLGVQA